MTLEEIDRCILVAHAAADGQELSKLYAMAGTILINDGHINKGCFFLTQSYVFSLEEGLPAADDIYNTLVKLGHDR